MAPPPGLRLSALRPFPFLPRRPPPRPRRVVGAVSADPGGRRKKKERGKRKKGEATTAPVSPAPPRYGPGLTHARPLLPHVGPSRLRPPFQAPRPSPTARGRPTLARLPSRVPIRGCLNEALFPTGTRPLDTSLSPRGALLSDPWGFGALPPRIHMRRCARERRTPPLPPTPPEKKRGRGRERNRGVGSPPRHPSRRAPRGRWAGRSTATAPLPRPINRPPRSDSVDKAGPPCSCSREDP